jgi:hypothetical protein
MSVNLRLLTAVLGMMGSSHDGEILAAAKHAERIRKESGLTWHDVIKGSAVHDPTPIPDDLNFRTAAICLNYAVILTEWERGFLQSLVSKRYLKLSVKQGGALRRIVKKIQGGGTR